LGYAACVKEKAVRPRRRVGLNGQQEILRQAAIEVFAERGIEQTSVEDVLQRAQVSRQTFYRCYRNKAELVDAVHSLITERLRSLMASMGSGVLGAPEALSRDISLMFDHAASSGPIVCELERQAMRPESAHHVHRDRRHQIIQRFLARWARQHFDKKPSPALVRAVLLGLEQLWLEVAHTSGKRSLRVAAEKAARELVEAMLLHAGVDRGALRR